MSFDDLDNFLKKQGINFDSSIHQDNFIYYFVNGLLVGEVQLYQQDGNIVVDFFEAKNKLIKGRE